MVETAASATDVTVRTFRPEDEERVLQLLAAAFDGWPHREVAVEPMEYLRWKLSSSEEALASHVVAEAASTIVGCRIFRFFDVQAAGRGLRAFWAFDASVHPDFRRQRVMTRVRDFSLDLLGGSFDLQMGGYTRNPAIHRLHSVEERYPFANPIEVLERPAGAASIARADVPWTITAPTRFDERIDAFWDAASRQFEFITVRDRQVLNWRYCDVRGGSFQVRLAEQAGRVLAYIVFRREHAKGYIADLLALPAARMRSRRSWWRRWPTLTQRALRRCAAGSPRTIAIEKSSCDTASPAGASRRASAGARCARLRASWRCSPTRRRPFTSRWATAI